MFDPDGEPSEPASAKAWSKPAYSPPPSTYSPTFGESVNRRLPNPTGAHPPAGLFTRRVRGRLRPTGDQGSPRCAGEHSRDNQRGRVC
ncbi:MAG: hypothetical protein ACK55Z_08270 [bacterium]